MTKQKGKYKHVVVTAETKEMLDAIVKRSGQTASQFLSDLIFALGNIACNFSRFNVEYETSVSNSKVFAQLTATFSGNCNITVETQKFIEKLAKK